MKLGVLACSKQKLGRPAPALELYQGETFRRAAAWLRRAGCTRLVILSALHGAVAEDEVLAPYECSLAALPAPARRGWAVMAHARLAELTAGATEIVAVVPNLYAAALAGLPVRREFAGLPIGRLLASLGAATSEAA